METRVVLKIHINRQMSNIGAAFHVTAEEGVYEENERFIPVVYTFICETVEQAKALRDEILSRYPDAIEEIQQQVKGDR